MRSDFRKVRKSAERQGWRVRETKEYWYFYPPTPKVFDRTDERYQPCRIGHTPSGSRTWANFIACLRRKGYDG